jgi:hypothetical protein
MAGLEARMTLHSIALGALVMVSLLAAPVARAECVSVPPKVVMMSHNDVVFSGKVVDITRTAELAYRATFEVDHVWAGSVTKHFDLYVREETESPRYEKGRQYMAFANRLTSQERRQGVGLGKTDTVAFAPVSCSDEYSLSDFIRNLDPGEPPKPDVPDQRRKPPALREIVNRDGEH